MRWVISFLLFFAGAAVVGLEVFVALALMEGGRSMAEQALGLSRLSPWPRHALRSPPG